MFGGPDPWLWLALLIGVPGGLAVVLRAAGAPGGRFAPAIAAGVLGGALLGPGVFGRAAPETHQRLAVGATAERRAFEAERARLAAHRLALAGSGVSPAAVDELAMEHADRLAPLRLAYAGAASDAGEARARVGMALTFLTFLATGGSLARTARVIGPAWRPMLLGLTIPAAAWAATAAIAAPVLGRAWLVAAPLAAVGFGPGRPRVPGGLARAREARGVLALTVLGAIVWCGMWGALGPLLGAALAGLATGALTQTLRPRLKRALRAASFGVGLPALTAYAGAGADPHAVVETPSFWIALLVVLLLGADLRWGAVRLALAAMGRPARAWTASAAGADHGASIGQVFLTASLFQPAPSATAGSALAAALLLGALAVELSVPLRDWLARRLDDAAGPRRP